MPITNLNYPMFNLEDVVLCVRLGASSENEETVERICGNDSTEEELMRDLSGTYEELIIDYVWMIGSFL